MKTDPQTIRQFLAEARNCAMQMMKNGNYIQKELPSQEMPHDLRSMITNLCEGLISTKHDLMNEIFELAEYEEPPSYRIDLWKQITRDWIFETIDSIDQCVVAIKEAVNQGVVSDAVSLLVMESAVNIFKSVPSFVREEKEQEENTNEPDNYGCHEDDDDEEEDENDYDPSCFAFHIEDSYAIEILTKAVRGLMVHEDADLEAAAKLRVFLFALERLRWSRRAFS